MRERERTRGKKREDATLRPTTDDFIMSLTCMYDIEIMASSPSTDIGGRVTCGQHLFPTYANLINSYTENCAMCAHMRARNASNDVFIVPLAVGNFHDSSVQRF